MSPSDTSLVKEVGTNVDRVDWDGAERVEGAEFVCRDLNWASLRLTVA